VKKIAFDQDYARDDKRYAAFSITGFNSVILVCVTLLLLCESSALAKQPEIANIYPDFPGSGDAPKIITGEGFDPSSTRVWTWSPKSDEAAIKKAVAQTDRGLPPLPTKPPKGAQSHGPIDVETQIIVANVRGSVMWVETAEGFSKPLMFNVAKPCWLSESKASPGTLVYVFGFGLKAPYGKTAIAITGRGGTFYPRRIVEARALRTTDSRLAYFEVPREIKPGQYAVYLHNNYGAQWGWREAGDLQVVAAQSGPKRTFDVRTFGAKGDGFTNDRSAIFRAIEAAHQAGGGTVCFSAGTYPTDETISVPSGVKLCGANRQTCILQGIGDPLQATRKAWFHRATPPTAIVRLHSNTDLESLTVQGATWKGQGSHSPVEAVPNEITFPTGGEVRDVTVVNCCIRANEEDPRSRRPLYRSAFYSNPQARRIKILSNEIFGGLGWGTGGSPGQAYRIEIIGNTIHGGGLSDVVTIGGGFSQSLIDDNQLIDTPGRICVGMGWHNYFRFNEIHQAFRSTWENAEEVYLVHGGVRSKTISFATGSSANALTDTRQNWKPDFYYDATVLIISGRGFGQYRRVISNTKDTLMLEKPWNVEPDSTTEYLVSALFTENAFFANLNDTPCRMSFWLDSVANLVEMHRDDHAKGADIVGEDRSIVDKNGIARDLTRFFPVYYNMFINSWLDGSALWLTNSGSTADNAHRGYSNFGTFMVGNRIRQPHTCRTGFHHQVPRATPGISVSGGSSRAGTSHTIVSDNFFGSTYTGIRINPMARKTMLLRNEFDHVDEPIVDQGLRTIVRGNRLTDPDGSRGEPIPDMRSERDLPKWAPRPWTAAPSELVPPLFRDIAALKYLVSEPLYTACSGVDSVELKSECQQNLRRLFTMLKEYDAQNGHLPKAAFFPLSASSPDSLSKLLGPKAGKLLVCPVCSPELKELGLNYVWNEKTSAHRLADLKPGTWLLMDCAGAHDWMVSNHYCGHLGQVNVLYADGTVKSIAPFSTAMWQDDESGTWIDWARQ
jgi:prepilin-type processing-associated H-X9-DG protein